MEETVVNHLDVSQPAQAAAKILLEQLTAKQFFSVNSVLLLSGGSAVQVAKSLLELIPNETSLSSVTVALADERFGPLNSKDSNVVQLAEAGVIDLIEKKGGTFIPLLRPDAATLEDTAQLANGEYEQMLKTAEQVVLLAGIGVDGHTTGMLPTADHQSFGIFSSDAYVIGYTIPSQSDNPHKIRLTTTLATLSFVDTVYVFATGEEKRPALTAFIQKSKPMHQLPALALYLSQQPVQILTTLEL